MDFSQFLRENIVLFDGAFGTVLQKKTDKTGTLPELLNLERPELIRSIHEEYAAAGADVLVSRAGSNTLCEILALKKPSLLIPYPKGASRGDQVENARYFEKRGLCHVLQEKDLSPQTLQNALKDLADDHDLPVRLARAPFKSGNGIILSEIMSRLE